MEDNKATITASEDELLKIAEKIRHNRFDDKYFRNQLNRFLEGRMPNYERFELGEPPYILKILGSSAKELVMNQSDVRNALADKTSGSKNHTEGHEILPSEIYHLSECIRNPIVVLQGNKKNPNSVIMVTELKNKESENVFATISLNRQNGNVDRINTLYGKRNIESFFSKNIDRILAVNKEKADKLYKDIGNQYSQLNTVICFDNSIAYTTANVKGIDSKNRENGLKLSIDRNSEVLFEDNKINTVLFCDDDTLKTLAERTRVFEKTNATFKDMLTDDYTTLYVYADFYPNGEVEAWLSMQSDTYGWDYYDVPLKDSEKETLLYDLDDIAYAREDASAAQWLKEVEVVETEAKEEPDKCVFEDNQGGGRGRK